MKLGQIIIFDNNNHKGVSIKGFAPSFNVAKGSVSYLRNQWGIQSPTDSENGTRRLRGGHLCLSYNRVMTFKKIIDGVITVEELWKWKSVK